MHRTVFPILSLVACVVATGCGTTTGTGGGVPTSGSSSGTSTSGTMSGSGGGSGSGTGPTISFTADVMPIFRTNCAKAGACHNDPLADVALGGPGKAGGRPYLGTAPDGGAETPMDMMKVYATLLGPTPPNHTTSWELVSPTPMPYITPRDPANSYMMIKMDGKQMMYDQRCLPGDYGSCGLPMPSDDPQLKPIPEREKVRSWIMQGAPNN